MAKNINPLLPTDILIKQFTSPEHAQSYLRFARMNFEIDKLQKQYPNKELMLIPTDTIIYFIARSKEKIAK